MRKYIQEFKPDILFIYTAVYTCCGNGSQESINKIKRGREKKEGGLFIFSTNRRRTEMFIMSEYSFTCANITFMTHVK